MKSNNKDNVLYGGRIAFNRMKKSNETYLAILDYCEANGYTPTRQALADHMEVSIGCINGRLANLRDSGRVSFDKKNGQMIVVETDD